MSFIPENLTYPVDHLDLEQIASWQRLSHRMIWVDLAQSLLAMTPAVVAVWWVGFSGGFGQLWPLAWLAVIGVGGALYDAWRWIFTRFRITDEYVELTTGLFVKKHRSIRRERIRSVDVQAKLRHRLGRLRVIKIGAGDQSLALGSTLNLDAVALEDAGALQQILMSGRRGSESNVDESDEVRPETENVEVFATFSAKWIIYNVVSVWSVSLALGLLWGAYWFLDSLGIHSEKTLWQLLGPEQWGWPIAIALGTGIVFLVGFVAMAINFFVVYYGFELARVRNDNGSQLRTQRGLLTRRIVNLDDERTRGMTISEPTPWRWLGVANTEIITTGISLLSTSEPASILPRGPVALARKVAPNVLQSDSDPFAATLTTHPPAALRRRLSWATMSSAALALTIAWFVFQEGVSAHWLWIPAGLWPLACIAAYIAYRNLGHGRCDDYLVVRSGLLSRATSVLRREAVSGLVLRDSFLQRRLGLRTVTVCTAAGYGGYQVIDASTADAVAFAQSAAGDLLAPWIEDDDQTATR